MRAQLAFLALAAMAGAAFAQTGPAPAYDAARHALKTSAIAAPSPQGYDEHAPGGVEVIRYAAPNGDMLAWVLRPMKASAAPRPVIVYAHGGFALGDGDAADAIPFLEAGFIVMMPTVRGENGNPGHFELFLGEVDDLIAAAARARTLAGADPARVYLFGHSIGGGLATLVALSKDNPYRLVGATGGSYPIADCAEIAEEWGTFNARRPAECQARFPDPWLAGLASPLYAYAGREDRYAAAHGQRFKAVASANYHFEVVKGDHFSAVPPSIRAFIAEIAKQETAH